MNFDKIFFQLLIIKTLVRCGLSQMPALVAPISEIIAVDYENVKYTSALLGQYDNEDHFCIMDANITLYGTIFGGDFSSNMIEFTSLYDVEMEFIYRRTDDLIIRFKCVFSEKQFIQAFFRRIYSYQEKGDDITIFRIARYFNNTRQLEPYITGANLYAKDIASFSGGYARKTYFITHTIGVFGTIEVDFIFHAKQFAISQIYNKDKIALCFNGTSDIRILISFNDEKNMRRYLIAFMHDDLQHDNLSCEFPKNLTDKQISENLDDY